MTKTKKTPVEETEEVIKDTEIVAEEETTEETETVEVKEEAKCNHVGQFGHLVAPKGCNVCILCGESF